MAQAASSTSETVVGSTTTIVETTVEVRSVAPGKTKRQIDNLYPPKSHALQISKYGDTSVFQWAEVSTVQIQSPYDIIIKVSAAGVNPFDYKFRKGNYAVFGKVKFPLVLGLEFSGIVVAKGEKVNKVHLLDKIWGTIRGGCYSEFIRVNTATEYGVALKPTSVSHIEAAGAPICALSAYGALVTLGELPVGDKAEAGKHKVLIIGASGGVGTFAVQIAKVLCKAKVTAVCSGANAELVRRLGADKVVDYTIQDFTADENDYDVVVDCVGNQNDFYHKTIPLLKKKGTFVSVAFDNDDNKVSLGDLTKLSFQYVGRKFFGARKYRALYGVNRKDFSKLVPYFERHEIKTVVAEKFPLREAAKAHEKIETRRTAGKIILTT
uniref:Reticulon-4-interacting protein 1, mitochondrial n=1 Tax=Anthurium amnicola TaxID=1678845 RepID=A0A1D1XXH1_9ARAE